MKLTLYILILMPFGTMCQTLVEGSMLRLTQADGADVVLYSSLDCEHCYYYLPSSLRIATGSDKGTPEASLVTWKDDETSDITGGILHFLVEWGLTAEQETDAQRMLRAVRDSIGVIMGPATVYADDNIPVIDGNDRLSVILIASLKNTPSVPSTPGAKMALSFRFTSKEIEDFLFYVQHPEKTKTDLKVSYSYKVQTTSGVQRTDRTTLRLPFRQILATVK